MKQFVKSGIRTSLVAVASGLPMFALGGGKLAATQALTGLSTEFSGPLAFAGSLIAIVGSALYWYRHHHDMGALSQAGLGTLFVAGVALGAPTVLSFIPGVAGALI